MKPAWLIITATSFLWAVQCTFGQTNTACTNAIAMVPGTNYLVNTSAGPTSNDAALGCGANIAHGVWYSVAPAINQRVILKTAGSSFPTYLAIYTNTCGALSNVLCNTGNGQFGGNGTAAVDFSGRGNLTYYILAGSFSGQPGGNLQISATLSNPPPNDLCAGAADLTTSIEDITYATELGDGVDACGLNIGHGVWYALSPGINQRVILRTAGSTFPTCLAIYTNSCGALHQVACNTGNGLFGGNGIAAVDFSSRSNVTYHILAGGFNGQPAGTLQISATLTNPPANDTCAGAIDLSIVRSNAQDITYATELNDATDSCGMNIGHGVWYTLTPASNQRVILGTAGSSFPTFLAVYTNVCGALSNVVCNSGGGLYGGNGTAAVDFSSRGNVTYHILAGGFSGQPAGTLQITATLTNPPSNDTCVGAIDLTTVRTNIEDVTYATELGDATDSCGANIGHGVWYTVTPAIDQRVIIRTAGSTFPTSLAIYTNSCGALSNILCNSGSGLYNGNGTAAVDFSSRSGVTYHVLAGGFNGQPAGALQIAVTLTNPPSNDTCAGAIDLTKVRTNIEDITYATEPGDATDACGVAIGHGVWYTVTPSINQRVIITTAGSSFPTFLAIYTNACGALSNIFCNSGSGLYNGNGTAAVDFSTRSNVTYHILAGGFYGQPAGTLQITATLTNPPVNDTCAGAIDLTTVRTNIEDITYAIELGDAADPCGANVGHGVWYTVTPAIDERVIIRTAGSTFPTFLAIYTNSCGTLSNMLCNSGNGYFGGNGTASADFSSRSNITYHILAGGFSGQPAGTLQITAVLTNPPANDQCGGAIALTNGVPFLEDTTYATEFGDAATDLFENGIGHGVWFSLAAFQGQQVTISTCTSSYNGNTDLMVYTNACGSPGNPVLCSSGSTPFGCPGQAGLSYIAPANLTYYILVSGVGTAAGSLSIVANVPPPTNNLCNGAISLTSGVSYSTNTTYATSLGDPVPSCAQSFGRGVWFKYTPALTGPVGVTTCGSTFQMTLAVYRGACGALSEVACSQNPGAYCVTAYNADLNYYGTNGTTYYILAGGINGQAGTLQILIPVVDLAVTNLAATNFATAGRGFSAGWTIQNQGLNALNGTWIDTLTLSNASTQVVLSSTAAHGLSAGGSYPENFVGLIPQIPAGVYSLVAQADAGGAVAEANKANNTRVQLMTVTNIPPAVTMLTPTNLVERESCVPVSFLFHAQINPGSYTITNVVFYDGYPGVILGHAPVVADFATNFILNFGTHAVGVQVMDNFGLSGTSSPLAMVTVRYPTNLHVLRADLTANGDFVGCMCAFSGSNYVVESSTNLVSPMPWPPLSTNLAVNSVLAFTNHPADTRRFFRARLLP